MIAVARLAALLARTRLRYTWNTLRARPGGPVALLTVFGLASAVAYVALFSSALETIGRRAGLAGETTALTMMLGAIALASLGAKASGEGLFAGTPENEFLLTRPVSISRLVLARCLASLLTDPLGTLFLLPALLAAAVAWRLSPVAWVIAVAISLPAQLAIAAVAQTVQIAVVRWVPRQRRSWIWIVLKLGAALAMASVWVAGTWILRAPDRLAPRLVDVERWLRATPARLLAAPLAGYRDGGGWAAAPALAVLAAVSVGAVLLTMWVTRRAGLHGWEEAGAPWAETTTDAPPAPPLTLARREWRLLVRDRPRLVALVTLPALFFGVQILGTVGWSWSTATVGRVAMLTFSVALYMAALGPLGHMQGERRAFWIVRSAPLSVGRLMAAKARVWAAILGGVAAALFFSMSIGISGVSGAELGGVGALVVGGAVAMSVLAVAMGCLAADLSDEQRSALGPGTIYLFLLLGGLFNVVLGAHGWEAARLVLLFLGALAAYWRSGTARVEICLDPEALGERTVRLADAATLVLIFALAPGALARGLGRVSASLAAAATGTVAALWVVGLAAAVVLLRRSDGRRFEAAAPTGPVRGRARQLGIGLACGAACVLGLRGWSGSWSVVPEAARRGLGLVLIIGIALGEELVFRGVLQQALQNEWIPRRGVAAGRWMAALVGVAAVVLASPSPSVPLLLVALATAGARSLGGGLSAALAARLVIVVAPLQAWL